jgi:hypothetical protein
MFGEDPMERAEAEFTQEGRCAGNHPQHNDAVEKKKMTCWEMLESRSSVMGAFWQATALCCFEQLKEILLAQLKAFGTAHFRRELRP